MKIISKEILKIKVNISENTYSISLLNKTIDSSEKNKEDYLKELKGIVINKEYKNYCFTCEEDINSNEDEFCIKCGWYKCSWCKSCGCNYMNSKVNGTYKYILNNNTEAKMLKENIEDINVNLSKLKVDRNVLEKKNEVFKEKLKEFVKFGVKK